MVSHERVSIHRVSDAIVGGLVTGGFALLVLYASLRHATRQSARDEAERMRVRRADRLRDSYRDYVVAAYALQGSAALIPIAFIESQRGRGAFYKELMGKQEVDLSIHNASLMLEEDTDQAIMREFSALNHDHMAYLLFIRNYMEKGEKMDEEEYIRHTTALRGRADTIARLARERLADLEQPPPLVKKPWWKFWA